MDLAKADSKPDVAQGVDTCFPCSTAHSTLMWAGTHSSGCCQISFTSDHSFPTSVRELRYMLVSHVPRRPGLLFSSGSEWSWGSHLTPQQLVGCNRSFRILTVRAGCTGSGPCLPLSSQPTSFPPTFPFSLGTCMYACMLQSCQLFWDPMELWLLFKYVKLAFASKGLILPFPLQVSLPRDLDKWIIHIA